MKLGTPPDILTDQPSDWVLLGPGTVVWRVLRTSGPHLIPWDQLRYWGPSSARFDPHPPPPRVHSGAGVSYAAADLPTALAEVFGDRRVVNSRRHDPYVVAWRPARNLRLLDLRSTWPVRNGASHAITSGRHDLCRAWARAINARWPDADGLLSASAMTGRDVIVVWTPAADSFPSTPELSLPLAHPGLRSRLVAAAGEIGFDLA